MDPTDSLEPGTPVGAYTIVGRLGEGGMGTVYRARDPKLNRDVAIKIIRSDLTASPDRHLRFEREARILASLSHPNIGAIYGLDAAGPSPALVMELVEGPSLADRLAHGPMPQDDALRMAGQIAEALEYAHDRGIVHRDLKPENVKLTFDGAVKVLDFGLAKAVTPESAASVVEMPTVTGITEIGTVAGTPAYMSPEQATGQTVDRRTDVWAFGCVLFEMLAGARAFAGKTTTDTIAAVLGGEPHWSTLPADTPMDVQKLLRRCLRKDPRQRLQAIGDARIVLAEIRAGAPGATPRTGNVSSFRRTTAEIVGGAVLATAVAAAAWHFKPAPASAAPIRSFTIALPPGQHLASLDRGALAFSDNDSQLAYVADEGGVQRIYLRAMETGATTGVAGTEGATIPFFSPDGQWLGFFSGGRLKKIPINGGAVTSLTDVPSAFGATWTAGHTIIFASLWSVLEKIGDGAPGAAQDFTQFAGAENSHVWPRAVPGRPSILFSTDVERGGSTIAVSDVSTGAHQEVLSARDVRDPSYAAPGHVIYLQADGRAAADNLMAVPVDPSTLHAVGDPALAVAGVRQYAISATGSLAYAAGGLPDRRSRFVWVDRTGRPTAIDEHADTYYQPRLDPVRGARIVTDLNGQMWMFDVATHNLAPFTFGDRNQHAVWTRDGQQLIFMTQKGRTWEMSSQRADGSGKPEPIASDAGRMDIPCSLTPDGALAYVKYSGTAESQLWVMPRIVPGGTAPPPREIQSIPIADAEAGPAFSPDGHWLAYAASDAAGHRQIYVQAYPGPGGKHQVSIDGGNEPQWNPHRSAQGLELFYRNGDDMMAVDIGTRDVFEQGKPHRLFSGAAGYQPVTPNYARANYDVSPDGQRFLMLQPAGQQQAPPTEIHVVLNWASSLAKLAPAGK